jgi:O-antigen ligase
MAVGCLPFIYYLHPISNWWQKALLISLLVFALIIIVFTGSRTGYVATILLGIYFWREKLKVKTFKYLIVGVIISISAYAFLPEVYTERLNSIITLDEAEGSSSETRIQILKDAVSVFVSKPWGVGVSAFPRVRAEMFGRIQDTHNLYLELLTNLSVLGVLSFFIFIRAIIKENKTIITRSNSPLVKCVAQAVIAFIYARLFLGIFGMDTYEIYWWFAAGLTMAMYRINNQHRKDDSDERFKSISNVRKPG